MKRTVKKLIKSTVGAIGRPEANATRILTYHSIGPRRHDMTVSAADFTAQMRWLKENARVIPLEAAVQGEHGVALTFDDGFVDNLLHAAPVLKELGFPAAVFMVAGRAGGYLDNEPDPEHGRIMTFDELRQLAAMGVEIGGHTMTHPHLSQSAPAEQEWEISACRRVLEAELQREVRAFAYPYGSALDYSEESMRRVQEAGYAFACSNRYGRHNRGDDRWQVRRIWIDATDSLGSFAAKVSGRLDGLRLLDSSGGIRLRKWMNK
jgi:peptidoglycan/xylan/chitin deacetylase (PgdA/CDA1 family)